MVSSPHLTRRKMAAGAEHGRFCAVSVQSARLEEGVIIRKKKISERYFTGAGEKINANNWVIP